MYINATTTIEVSTDFISPFFFCENHDKRMTYLFESQKKVIRTGKTCANKIVIEEQSDQGLFVCFLLVNHLLITRMGKSRPRRYKTFSYSTQLQSTKFILLINVKMPTIVGILTFMSMINPTSERHKAINFFICLYALKIMCSVELSMKKVL